jgi:hypothetical protein
MDKQLLSYPIDLDFEPIRLPPVTDILVLGKKTPQGKQGILQAFELILPDVFEMLEINDSTFPQIDGIIVNKAILSKIPIEEVTKVLKENVFPYICRGETIKVNFNVHIYKKGIRGNWAMKIGDNDTEKAKYGFSAELFHTTKNPIQVILNATELLRHSPVCGEREMLPDSITSNAKIIDMLFSNYTRLILRTL